jgi:large subunit ribosomal protein L40
MMFRNEQRRARIGRLKRLEDSIARTMKVLRETDALLYTAAVSGTREVEKRFPLVMRIPTDTLPTQWWNYKWTPVNIKGLGGVVTPG